MVLPPILAAMLVAAPLPTVPVTTYSIVARDPATGEMGVAVQSHYFSVGPIVPWAEAGVGAVATQSLVLVDYGPNGLALMRAGMSAPDALDSLRRADPNPSVRQVAMVDTAGRVAAHTGAMAIPAAGHQVGTQYSVQANLMDRETVWPAMARAYEAARGDLAERMMQALEAAEKEGGDIRGRQSAAILIVKATSTGKPWVDRVMDLRVEDHPEPLAELRRLINLRRAYNAEDAGDNAIAARQPEEALRHYEAAAKLAPGVVELQFWAAVSMYANGREAEAKEIFRRVFAKEGRWAELIPRLARVELFPNDPKKIEDVVSLAPRGGPR
jgi:uncharacterized Ntn-hydrolase superfamily protein